MAIAARSIARVSAGHTVGAVLDRHDDAVGVPAGGGSVSAGAVNVVRREPDGVSGGAHGADG